MITEEIVSQIRETFAMEPTGDQARAMQVFAEFLVDRDAQAAMILRGSAGTGKTTLASAMVRLLLRLGRKVVLMAPTGRAAKVFSLNSGQAAMTIHKRIYRQKSITGFDTPFALADNLSKDTVFMVDEASMIANEGFGESVFGTGRILDDLVKYETPSPLKQAPWSNDSFSRLYRLTFLRYSCGVTPVSLRNSRMK